MAVYLGNFFLGSSIEYWFNTTDAPGALITFPSAAVSVYESNNASEFTTGASISVDYDSMTGMHKVIVDTSSGYSANKDYVVWLTAGTVDGVSQVNMVLFQFSIQNRYTDANLTRWKNSIPSDLVDTDKIPASVQHMANDIITAAKFDESTAFPLKSADTGATALARTGADGDTLETLSDEIAAVSTTIGVAGAGLTEAGGTGDHLTAINLPNQTMDIVGNITGNLSGSVGSVTTVNDKTGYSLADGAITTAKIADGAITSAKFTVSAVSGVATGILEKLDQLWRRFFKKVTKESGSLITYADDGTTPVTTQTYTTTGTDTDETVGAGS